MDWPYSSEACDKRDRHLAGILKESGKAKTNVAKECGGRVEGNRN